MAKFIEDRMKQFANDINFAMNATNDFKQKIGSAKPDDIEKLKELHKHNVNFRMAHQEKFVQIDIDGSVEWFQIQAVPGDGNCLFRSIIEAGREQIYSWWKMGWK